jgi:YVTN family beta-propeller protein
MVVNTIELSAALVAPGLLYRNYLLFIGYSSINDALYVSRDQSGDVSVINALTNADVKDIKLSDDPSIRDGPVGLAYNPANNYIYVPALGSNRVFVIDSNTNSVIDVVALGIGNRPSAIAYNPINHNMYVTNQGSNNVSVIDSATNEVIAQIPAGNSPTGITYDSSNQHMYVSNLFSNTVTMIHP